MEITEIAKKAVDKGAIQKVQEFAALLNVLKVKKPAIVVEIGTAKGGTFYAFCKIAASDATLISIDLPGGPFGGGLQYKGTREDSQIWKKESKALFS